MKEQLGLQHNDDKLRALAPGSADLHMDSNEIPELVKNTKDKEEKNYAKEMIQTYLDDIDSSLGEHKHLSVELKQVAEEMIGDLEKGIYEVERVYENIFPKKPFDKGRALEKIGSRAVALLSMRSWELLGEDQDYENKEKVLTELAGDLRREKITAEAVLSDVLERTKQIDSLCADLAEDMEYNDFLEIMGNPEKYKTPADLNRAIESGEIENWWMNTVPLAERFKSFNSDTINRFVEGLLESAKTKQLEYKDYFEMEKRTDFEHADPIDKTTLKRVKSEIEEKKKTASRFVKLASLRSGLEELLEANVYLPDARDEKFDPEKTVSRKVFAKYQEIIDLAKTNKDEIKKQFKDDRNVSDDELEKITDSLLSKARDLLKNYTDGILNGVDEAELLAKLEGFKADILLSAGVWKSIDKDGLKLEDLKGVSLEKRSNHQLIENVMVANTLGDIYSHEIKSVLPKTALINTESIIQKYASHLSLEQKESIRDIVEMVKIYGRNYENRPEMQEELLDGFILSLRDKSKNTNLYVLKKYKTIMAFIRFDDLPDKNTKYAGSFNIDTNLNQMSLGGALFLESHEIESKEADIIGLCDGLSPANIFYVEKGGYVVESIDMSEMDKNNFADFHIRRSHADYKGKAMSDDDIIKMAENNMMPVSGTRVVSINNERDKPSIELMMRNLQNENLVISRIVKTKEKIYCMLEDNQAVSLGDNQIEYRKAA